LICVSGKFEKSEERRENVRISVEK
jgi:hypothetical protein